MKKLALFLTPFLFLTACAVPDPYPVYVDRPVVVHHNSPPPDEFRAVEKPSTYSGNPNDSQ